MALTKIGTDGVKDDAITSGKIPANAVGNSELALNSVQGGNLTNSAISNDKVHPSANIAGSKLADNSISLAKLEHGTSSNDGKFLRANNGADPTFETVNTDLVADTSPQLGGDLDTNSHNISLDDNHKVNFGDSNDLQIYHDGSHSIVEDAGTGQLRLCGDNGVVIRKGPYSDVLINAVADGAVELYHGNEKKLETKNNGVNIQGVNSTNVKLEMHGHDVLKRSWWGYSTGYNGVTLGRTDVGTASTIFMGVDVTGNSSGSFGGQGNEIVFRNNHQFVTPNAANNNYNTMIRFGRGTSTEGAVNFPNGCLFGADQANANILDDYEEGSWTPAVSGGSGTSHHEQYGRYTKVGRLVVVSARIKFSCNGTSGNQFSVGGLPFTSASGTGENYTSGGISYCNLSLDANRFHPYIGDNQNRVYFYEMNSGAGVNIGASFSNKYFGFSAHYFT